jgi:uncharacterized protein YabN with tetrapyrrole methylase and pyrophosphatase domain
VTLSFFEPRLSERLNDMEFPNTTMEREYIKDEGRDFHQLFDIVRTLGVPEGCPWDKEQSPYSIYTNLIEGAYERVSAIAERG